MAIINSTVFGNSAIYGGGIDNHNVLTIYNCTMVNNSALTAGGIFSDPVVTGPIYIWNSILSGNSGSYASPDCTGPLTSEDYNKIGTTSGCGVTLAPHDSLGAALLLGPLQSNGGPTFTVLPGAGSPAINGGNPAGCAGPNGTILKGEHCAMFRPATQVPSKYMEIERDDSTVPVGACNIRVKSLKRKFLAAILCSNLFLLSGCLESNFKLSDKSRLPVWIHLPPKMKREDVSLTLNYYSNPFGPNAKFILRDKHGETLEEVSGEDTRIGTNLTEYPMYVLVVVNGISEIVEHRTKGPVFYISDDPAIKSKIPHGK